MMKTLLTILTSAGLLLISGHTFAADQAEQVPEQANARNGAQAWVNNCARCHNFRRTDEFSDREWIPIIDHMRIRAGLTGQEAREILKFLQASNDRS